MIAQFPVVHDTKDVFSRMHFREDERERERERENFLKCFLLGGGKREKMVRSECFLSGPIIKFSPQNGKKIRYGEI